MRQWVDSRQPLTEPLTARTRALVDALQVSPETSSEGQATGNRGHGAASQFPAVTPQTAQSPQSSVQGVLVFSEDGLLGHPLSEALAGGAPLRETLGGADGETTGNSLPSDFISRSDPLDEDSSPRIVETSEPAELPEEERKEVRPPYGWPVARDFPKWYLRRLTGFDQSLNTYGFYPSWDLIVVFVFIALTMVTLGLIEHYGFQAFADGKISAFIPAFGATCTVVFGTPKAPIAQPRNVIIAHVTAAIIGTALTNAFRSVREQPFGYHCAGAIGVGLHLALMMVTNTMHPPASATVISAAINPINAYFKDEGFLFCVTPVLFGSLVIVIMAWFLNNIFLYRGPYPQYW